MTGTLKYLSEGEIADYWGAGNFIAVKFTSNDARATAYYARMNPTAGSGDGWVKLDSDMNGVWKVTDKTSQTFQTKTTAAGFSDVITTYDLSGLTIESENVG